MTLFRLRRRPDRAVCLQVQGDGMWQTIVTFYTNGKITRNGGLTAGCGLSLDATGRINRV